MSRQGQGTRQSLLSEKEYYKLGVKSHGFGIETDDVRKDYAS
jgi:hypothetical protein